MATSDQQQFGARVAHLGNRAAVFLRFGTRTFARGILVSFSWLYYVVPLSYRVSFGEWLGGVVGGLGYRRAVVRQNLMRAYPGEETAARTIRRDLEAEFYKNFGKLILEIFLLFGSMRRFVEKNVAVEGIENLEEAQKLGLGVLLLSSHLGNWEVMAATGGLKLGRLTIVTKRLKPKWFHEAVEDGRGLCSVRGTYEPRTLKDILGALRRRESVGIVLDQYAGHPQGVRVPFFGVPVGTSSGLAVIAKRTNAPVVPIETVRLPDGRFKVVVHPQVKWQSDSNPQREIALNTAVYASIIESFVRRTPEQWLWSHRRFKGDLSPLSPDEWTAVRVRAGQDA